MELIEFDWEGCRIDIFLAKKFGLSRNFFHHLIQRWSVKVNDKNTKKSYQLKLKDKIQIDDFQRFDSCSIMQESPDIDLEVKLEKSDYMVLYKPKWVLSHPWSIWDISSPSVTGFLYHKYKDLPSIWNFIRAGLIHRLDKNTDGLMIIVKTEVWLAYFKNLFRWKSESISIEEKEKVQLKKFYRANVNVTKEWKNFIDSITQFPYYIQSIVKTKWVYLKEYKEWITKILWYKKLDKWVFVDIEILTWRTHQIRYHLSQVWLPIVWDDLYWMWENVPMWLSSYRLEFMDNEWEYVTISI